EEHLAVLNIEKERKQVAHKNKKAREALRSRALGFLSLVSAVTSSGDRQAHGWTLGAGAVQPATTAATCAGQASHVLTHLKPAAVPRSTGFPERGREVTNPSVRGPTAASHRRSSLYNVKNSFYDDPRRSPMHRFMLLVGMGTSLLAAACAAPPTPLGAAAG